MRRRRNVSSTALLFTLCLGLCGCYSHVVDARGPNASRYEIHEPSNSDNVIDRTIDGLLGIEEDDRKRR